MPGRITPLVINEIYHVFNRGIDHRPTFLDKREFERAVELNKYYRFVNLPVKFSTFGFWSRERRKELWERLFREANLLVDTISYCLMPNHFHFLLKQKIDGGMAKFMSNFQNSYTRYFNSKHLRSGPIFLDQFKAVRIETEEQLLHVFRYIHLNPYSSYIVKTLKGLKEYAWSSLPEFLGLRKDAFCQKEEISSNFRQRSSLEKFIFDQADYQRSLEKIKHLLFEVIP